MSSAEGMWVVGTIQSIELHTTMAKFQGVPPRQIAKLLLNVEQAKDSDGTKLRVENLSGIPFQGAPELILRFAAGERVQIVTTTPSGMHIGSIKPVPLS